MCLKLAVKYLEKGLSVLYLAPEIGVSGQLESYIRQSVPSLLVYHSELTAGKRKQVAQVLRTGQPCMILGTRSSLFLPFAHLGLIIVDQENDTSYKQDSPPHATMPGKAPSCLPAFTGPTYCFAAPRHHWNP